jgi:hypothetical protein
MSNRCRNILLENSICKSLLQGVVARKMRQMLLLRIQRTLGSTLHLSMILSWELDTCHSVAKLVIALHRHRKVVALIPAGMPIVTFFFATGLDLVLLLRLVSSSSDGYSNNYFSSVHTIARKSITTVSRITRACIRSIGVVTCCIGVACWVWETFVHV